MFEGRTFNSGSGQAQLANVWSLPLPPSITLLSLSVCVCVRSLLLCRVILGKSHKQTSAQRHSHAPPGHHSVTGSPTDGGLVYTEYVIYRGEQVSRPLATTPGGA